MVEILRMYTASGDGLELQRYEDVIFAKYDSVHPELGVKTVQSFKYKLGDIIMCSYPKCGTHWLGNIIWKLKTCNDPRRSADALLELGPSYVFDTMESPRIIMTHLSPRRLPPDHFKNGGKLVLILRNPKDVIVSMFFHLKKSFRIQNKQTWNEFFQSFTSGLVPFGSYFDYIQQWELFLKEKSTGRYVEVFYYEDLKANIKYNTARLNQCLGFNRDNIYIENVIKSTTLSALREQDAAGKRRTFEMVRDEKGDSIIYRKGEVGDWKKYFTVAQSEIVDKLMEERLKYGILNFKYEL